jgi:hypothetical protein
MFAYALRCSLLGSLTHYQSLSVIITKPPTGFFGRRFRPIYNHQQLLRTLLRKRQQQAPSITLDATLLRKLPSVAAPTRCYAARALLNVYTSLRSRLSIAAPPASNIQNKINPFQK